MGSGFSKMKKQARMMQEQFSGLEKKLKNIEETGTAPNGLVKIVLTGEKELKKIEIQPECVNPDDIEGLQDLIIAAYNDASKKVDNNSQIPKINDLPFSF